MSSKSIHLFLGVLIFAWAAVAGGAEPLQQDPGPDGIVCVEAENYDVYTERTNTWILITEVADGYVPDDGFSGGYALQSTPTGLAEGGGITSDIETRSPQLDYVINFSKIGTYYIWLLAYGMDGNSDSCHAGLDGVVVDTATVISGFNGNYAWISELMSSDERPRVEVTTTGLHTFNIWMRETGATIDKILLTSNPDYTPTGSGPAESLRGARFTASGANPADTATDVPRDAVLSWTPGETAVAHDVYFGTTFDDVNLATRANPLDVLVSQAQDANSYAPDGVLAFGQTYYWRIDEVNEGPGAEIFPGGVWSFTVEPFSYPIENITATASSSMTGSDPQATVDGSGLDADDLHSDDVSTMWLTARDAATPAWIQYEFDRVYKLYEMFVWNYNMAFEVALGYGFKDVTIEYSEDGVDWTVLTEAEFAQGLSAPGYASNTMIDLGGLSARFVRLTANDNWGALTQYGLSEVRFTYIPAHPRQPEPASGATEVGVGAVLNWRAGREAAMHEIYLGTDEVAVADGSAWVDTLAEHSYDPGGLDYGQTYYWQIVEVNEAEAISTWAGDIWNFSTQEYVLVDDFESYDDEENRIYQTWTDGWVNDSGALVGYFDAPFAEQTITHGGAQSMPIEYNNDESPWYSQADRTFEATQDWASHGADTLLVHFRGNPVDFAERADGSIVIGAAGTDIWGTADEFRMVYMRLTGDATIIARVDSVLEQDPWTKAGVMIRETLDPGSRFAAIWMTPGNGCRFHLRSGSAIDATSDTSVATNEQIAVTAPYWVKLERSGDEFTGSYSADGTNWTTMEWSPQSVPMVGSIYIGLAVTSHNAGQPTVAEFSEVSTTGTVTGSWEVATIGVEQPSNDAAPLYVALTDSNGRTATVTHPDPAAAQAATWQAWPVSLDALSAGGVNLAAVKTLSIGVGDPEASQADGSGLIYVDDIQVGHPTATEEAVEE